MFPKQRLHNIARRYVHNSNNNNNNNNNNNLFASSIFTMALRP